MKKSEKPMRNISANPAAFEVKAQLCADTSPSAEAAPVLLREKAPLTATVRAATAFLSTQAAVLLLAAPAFTACFGLPDSSGDTGSIQVNIGERFLSGTRSSIPDVNDFILEVTDSEGNTIYEGAYRDSPDLLEVPAGNYTVSALSYKGDSPAFDSPQYGDTQVVVVPSGQCVSVQMICTQLNSGLRLSLSDSFKEAFPDGKVSLKAAAGVLEFAYDETRIAYFSPGNVAILLDDSGKSETLFTRSLKPCSILSVNIGAVSGESGAGVSIKCDTTRAWQNEEFVYGSGGSKVEDALSVAEAKDRAGQQGMWVFGYIVGSFNTSSGPSFSQPFNKNTNVVIAPRDGTTDKNSCLSVELKSGTVRDEVNLKENASNLGRGIYLKGDIVDAYYGIPGLKNVTEYQWK